MVEGRERPGVFAPRTLVDAITRAGGESPCSSGPRWRPASPRLGGWSNHHQACDRLADGYLLSATTPDGCVEGMESIDGRVIAVQWHPEVDAAAVPHQQALFDRVVRAAAPTTL